MIGLTLKAVKDSIIEHEKVMDAAARASRRALFQFGGFVRTTARRSIISRKGVSSPGSPPSSHNGLLRDNILFVVEPEKQNVIIGPMLLNGTRSPTALLALEHGGESLIMRHGKPLQIMVRARPFMQPAFEVGMDNAARFWKDTLKE